mgnify:FL=1
MINALNLQNYQTTYTQNSTQKSSAVSFSERFNETHKNKNLVLFLSDEFKSKVYHQSSQTYKFNKEISQSKYENSISFIINKMQGILEKMSNDKQAYEMANSFYKGFLLILNPEQLVLKEIQANEFKITDIQAPKSVFVETYKNQSVEALKNKNYKANEYLAKLEESLGRYEASLKHIATHSMTFFSTFQSEFSESEMQEIIDELATIRAYNDYKAHNISLADGSTISWNYDKNGNMLVKINEFDINTALENADKALTEMENFKTLLEMFKQRENLNGLESGLNSENLHSNSHSNLTNSSENSGKNSNLQAKLNLINLNANSKQNLNFNTLNSSENLIANLNANSTQQSEIFTLNSTNLSLQNSNHRFTMLVESENVTSIISSQSANGDTIIGMWSPMIREKGAQETSRYLSNLINSNSKVLQKPSKAEFERAVKNISALMNELKNFVRSEQGYSQLSVDLQYLAPDDYERTLYESMQTSSNDSYDSLWMGAQIFFDFLNDKVSGLPKDEINAYISTIQAYLVATKLNANELKLTQNNLNFNSENLKLNDSLLKELLKSV